MIKATGNNEFIRSTFDKYLWAADTFENAQEMYDYITRLGLVGKKAKRIYAIGSMLPAWWKHAGMSKLHNLGIIEEEFSDAVQLVDGTLVENERLLKLADEIKVRREIDLCEPLIIVFEDDTSLEILPSLPTGVRIGYNLIPHEIRNGLNETEIDIGTVFNEIIADKEFKGVEIRAIHQKRSITREYRSGEYEYTSYRITFKFHWSEIILSTDGHNEYTLFSGDIISKQLNRESSLPYMQSAITDGPAGGGATNIYAVTDRNYCSIDDDFDCHPTEMFSFSYFLPGLLGFLLTKNFDSELNCTFGEEMRHYYDEYRWNYYTKDSIRKICNEVFEILEIAKDNPEDERCQELWKGGWKSNTSEENFLYQCRYNERFARRLLNMVNNSDGYDYISFVGP